MLFKENSLIQVRKFCILKPPQGYDSAPEDISATFSMLVISSIGRTELSFFFAQESH